ncbi:MAG: hypothetical protein KIT22_20640 [Verrucomicrobiae bacterium]|nr:hypothetical protein [Verrucomicrobiae bacterium]
MNAWNPNAKQRHPDTSGFPDRLQLWPPGLWFGGHAWRWIERVRIALHMPLGAWLRRWRRESYFRFERELEPFPPMLIWLLTLAVLGGLAVRWWWIHEI